MAATTPEKVPTITLIGQSASGKTNLLSALLHNKKCARDLELGPDGFGSAQIVTATTDDEATDRDFKQLGRQYQSILEGRDSEIEHTEEVRRYPILLESSEVLQPQKSGFLGGTGGRSGARVPPRLEFEIVDGRGGDIATVDDYGQADNEMKSRREHYRDGIADSQGMVICMPIQGEEFDRQQAQGLINEIFIALERKREQPHLPKLAHVSLCFTKYETLFTTDKGAAYDVAANAEEFIRLMRDQSAIDLFGFLLRRAQEDNSSNEFKLRVFPVSTFGFVEGIGAPNFYPYAELPGLKTRSVKETEYRNPNLPGLKDHYPVPINQSDAEAMWHPFNIAPPIIYALKGLETGPVSIPPEYFL